MKVGESDIVKLLSISHIMRRDGIKGAANFHLFLHFKLAKWQRKRVVIKIFDDVDELR